MSRARHKNRGGSAPVWNSGESQNAAKESVERRHGGSVHCEGEPGKLRADKRARGGKTPNFHPGGEKGKLHREMGIPVGQKIPAAKLAAAAHSNNPEKRRDAIRAQTMKKWHHTGPKGD